MAPKALEKSFMTALVLAIASFFLVEAADAPEKDGVVRWRCVDLRVKIAEQFSVTFHKRSVAKLLCKLDLTRLQPRPFHPKKDAAAQEAFKKTSPTWSKPRSPRPPLGVRSKSGFRTRLA